MWLLMPPKDNLLKINRLQGFSTLFCHLYQHIKGNGILLNMKILSARVRHAGLTIIELVFCLVFLEYYNAIFVSMAHLDQKIKGKER